MEIREITLAELQDFIRSDLYLKASGIPITPMRAMSQMHNPHADPDDVVLFTAYSDEGELLAYVGALPDRLRDGTKIVWNSCWYAHPEKAQTVALPLFLQFVRKWQGKILIRDLTPHTRKIVAALSHFRLLKIQPKIRYFTRYYFADLLTRKWPQMVFLKYPLKLMDGFVNIPVVWQQRNWLKRFASNTNSIVVPLTGWDDALRKFISGHQTNELSARGPEELKWVMKYPWLDSASKENKWLTQKYFFSSLAESFHYYPIKILLNDELIGFALLKEREHHFEVSYCYAKDHSLREICICLVRFMFSENMRSLAVANKSLLHELTKMKLPFIFRRTTKEELYASKELATKIAYEIILQDGDGDVVFT